MDRDGVIGVSPHRPSAWRWHIYKADFSHVNTACSLPLKRSSAVSWKYCLSAGEVLSVIRVSFTLLEMQSERTIEREGLPGNWSSIMKYFSLCRFYIKVRINFGLDLDGKNLAERKYPVDKCLWSRIINEKKWRLKRYTCSRCRLLRASLLTRRVVNFEQVDVEQVHDV